MPRMRALLATLLLLVAAPLARAEQIKVSAAISLQDAITEIAKTYKTGGGGGGDDVSFTFGSSGQLATQIKDGAPADVFISAANKQVDDLENAGFTAPATRRVVVGNTLVLITPAVAKDAPRNFAALANTQYKRIAIGEPKTVPAGDYAMQTLKSLKLDDKLTNRLILATNVRQVLTYVENGDVAAGIVYRTDALQSGTKVRIAATADEKTYEPIVYPGVVIKASKKPAAALKFLDYLKTDAAKKVFTGKGFEVNLPATTPAATAPTK